MSTDPRPPTDALRSAQSGTLGDTGLVNAIVLDGAGGGRVLDWAGVEAWQPSDGVLWLNLDYAAADAAGWIELRAGLDPLVRDALLDRDPRPRALTVGDALMLIVRAINLNEGAEPEDMVSLRCWIEPHRVITMRHRTVRIAKRLSTDLARSAGPRTAGDFVAEIVERTLEPLTACVDGIDDEVSRAEDEVLGEHGPALRARIAEVRRRAIALRRFVAPQREAFARLPSAALGWLHERERARLREAADRLTRTIEELDAARDRAAVTHEEMASRVGELTNHRLYVLSIVTALFLPLGFVTSLLGVNVGGVPGQDLDWGFWLLVGLFSLAAGGQLLLFRRWRWL
jgi:zinc transporter